MNIKSSIFKTALLAAGFGLFSANAFCAGTVTGSVDAALPKFKKDVVVYLKGVPGPIVAKKGVVDQKNLVFEPHVLALPTGSSVDFKNNDKVNHNIFSADVCNKFNLGTYNPGMSKPPVLFPKPCVVNLLCNVHSEMSGYVVVVDSNYIAVTDATGKFTIPNVPAGTYDVTVWSEKLKAPATKVTVANGGTATVALKLAR
jgi:plastocyanin